MRKFHSNNSGFATLDAADKKSQRATLAHMYEEWTAKGNRPKGFNDYSYEEIGKTQRWSRGGKKPPTPPDQVY